LYYNNEVIEIHSSARKHGIADADIRHAVACALHTGEIGDDPIRVLYLGPSRAMNILEIVTIVRAAQPELAIHAMAMRSKYRHLLTGGR
jgi:hypothetical protein